MHKFAKIMLAGAGALALSASVATAEVVCNEEGDCWRVRERAEYKPELKLRVYPDNWRWEDRDKDRYRWREVPADKKGGYWRGGVWVDIN